MAASRRVVEGAKVVQGRRLPRLVADLDAGPPPAAASGWASSAWAASARPWPAAPRPSACRCTTTTASRSARASPRRWGPPTGRAWTRCWPGWTSSRSTARTPRPPTTCCRPAGSSCCGRTRIIVNTARGEVIDEGALANMLAARRDRRGRPGRLRARTGDQPQAAEAAQRRAAAPHGLGHGRGPRRHGREGHRQHQDLDGRPPAAGPGDPVDAVGGPRRLTG